MTTSEILMTDPTTDAGRKYWEDRRRLEEWRERERQVAEDIAEILRAFAREMAEEDEDEDTAPNH